MLAKHFKSSGSFFLRLKIAADVSCPGIVPVLSARSSDPGHVPVWVIRESDRGNVPVWIASDSRPGKVPVWATFALYPGNIPMWVASECEATLIVSSGRGASGVVSGASELGSGASGGT